ncbi:MAG: cysteine desulfurase [Planctomycetes bacterium]|nr:cysteine desulfurase [Planctomycetota bacterium]
MRSRAASVYLDHAASTPLDETVLEAMLPYLRAEHANPSALHAPGVSARRALEAARERVLGAVSGRPGKLVFTSGGTEANNLAILGFGRARPGGRIVCSAVEHPSAARAAQAAAAESGIACARVQVDADGRFDLEHLAEQLSEKTSLVALIHGQNEIGVLEPIAEAAEIVRRLAPRAHLHVDAVQSFGKVRLDGVAAAADSLSLSAHKVHGPKGAGALVFFTGARPGPLLYGGGQEGGLRSGTENVAAIAGFGRAVELARASLAEQEPRLTGLCARLRGAFGALQGVLVLGGGAPRLPTIVAAVIEGARGEILQHHLEARGFVIGTGSACHAASGAVSATFEAIGLSIEQARSVVRVSLARSTTESDVERFLEELPGAVLHVRELLR